MANKNLADKISKIIIKNPTRTVVFIAIGACVAYLAALVINVHNDVSHKAEDWNDYASAIGGVVGTIINAVVAYLVYQTYSLQKQEIHELTLSAKNQAEQSREQALYLKQQSEYSLQQNFQSLFLLLIETNRYNLNDIETKNIENNNKYTGVAAVMHLYTRISSASKTISTKQSYIRKEMEININKNLFNLISKNDNFTKSMRLCLIYNHLVENPDNVMRETLLSYDKSITELDINTMLNMSFYDNELRTSNGQKLHKHLNSVLQTAIYIIEKIDHSLQSTYLDILKSNLSKHEKYLFLIHIVSTQSTIYTSISGQKHKLIELLSLEKEHKVVFTI